MTHLSIDIETKSSIDIGAAGAYKYAQSDDFQILLFAYKQDLDEVKIVDLTVGEVIPEHIVNALADPTVTKHAYNAAFEWWCLNQAGYTTLIEQWRCTMVHGLYCGYTAGLGALSESLGLPFEKQKSKTGNALISYFCKPCKPTKTNGGRSWNLPHHDKDKWELFKEYCIKDVVAESEIASRLALYPMPEKEIRLWQSDVKMNAFGMRVDENLISGALHIGALSSQKLMDEAIALTGLNNPNSNTQLLGWLQGQGIDIPNLQKDTVAAFLDQELPANVRTVLELRLQMAKTSIKKYQALDCAKGLDNRVRGVSQFYGANRTGRWAGRIFQHQNLPRNYLKTLDIARRLTLAKNYDGLKLIYGNVPDTLSQLVRTAAIPSESNKLIIADFASIEARIIAWLAGEKWVMEVFATHGKIYEATAAQMFNISVDLIQPGNPEYEYRQRGKVATLALGYQGGIGALTQMGAVQMGIPEDDLPDIVSRWRHANKRIVALWYAVEDAATKALLSAQPQSIHGITFALEGDLIYGQQFLTITLPSNRKLYYAKPFLSDNQWGRKSIHYYSMNQETKKWGVNSTYGGKLVENIVQAIARDCLAESLISLEAAGHRVVFHVHDEVVVDAPKGVLVEDVIRIMEKPIAWAPDLLLKADGFESEYFMKN